MGKNVIIVNILAKFLPFLHKLNKQRYDAENKLFGGSMKKIINILTLVLTIIILTSCTNNPVQVTDTPVHIDTPSQTSQLETPIQTSQPTASVQPSPEVTTQQLVKDDVPAYLAVGLGKRSKMPLELERFYYSFYYTNILSGTYSDTVDYSRPDYFEETTSVDLDGDGTKETISLIGGKPYDEIADNDPSFSDITIDIDGNKLNLKDKKDLPFTLNGKIVDIDKNDGKKEIFIEADIILEGTTDYIITYDDKKPRKIFEGGLNYPDYTTGTGCIITPVDYFTKREGSSYYIFYYDLQKMKSDRSGFEPAGNKYYPTLYQIDCWDEYGKWDVGNAAPSQSDQYLFKEPGGDEKVLVKKGTPVFIGLYAKKSWLMILDVKGDLLGWLDTDKVDFEEYTNHAFEPEGD